MATIKDIKPPRYYYPPENPIDALPLVSNHDAVETFFKSAKKFSSAIGQVKIEDLRKLLEILKFEVKKRNKSLRFEFHRMIFENANLNGLDLRELDLSFYNCNFLEDFDLRNVNLKSFSLGGNYIRGIFAIGNLTMESGFTIGSLQVDLLHIENLKTNNSIMLDFGNIGSASISNCEFDIYINNTSFLNPVWVDKLKGNNYFIISESNFEHDLYLGEVENSKRIEINNSIFRRNLKTEKCVCETLTFDDNQFNRIADLRGTKFKTISLQHLGGNGRLLLSIDQLKNKPNWPLQSFFDMPSKVCGDGSELYKKIDSAADQLLFLKENFHKTPGMKIEEDYCAYRLMDNTRKLSSNRHSRLLLYFYKNLFGYMVLPQRVSRTIILTIFFFAIIYSIGTLFAQSSIMINDQTTGQAYNVFVDDFIYGCARCVYFSVITFTTVGYGDIFPSGWLKVIAMTEGLLGVFLMSLFTVSIARKILRW